MINALDKLDLVIIGSVFGLVLSVWLICMFIWSVKRALRVQKVERRLGLLTEGETTDEGPTKVLRLWHEEQETTTTVPKLSTASVWERVERFFNDAGFEVPAVAIVLGLSGAVTLVFTLCMIFAGGIYPALLGSAAVLMGFSGYAKVRRDRVVSSFEKQFAEALGLVARSLRAGQPLLAGFRICADQSPEPVRHVFTEICQQQTLGIGLEESLRRISEKYSSNDVLLFVTAVVIQMKSGGNLAELMDRLAFIIRERMRLGRRVKVLTAQTQMSKRILIGLPFAVFLVINLLNPEYMNPLYTTPVGRMLLFAGAGSMLLGMYAMRRLAVLRY